MKLAMFLKMEMEVHTDEQSCVCSVVSCLCSTSAFDIGSRSSKPARPNNTNAKF